MKNSKWVKLAPKEEILKLKEKENFKFCITNLCKYFDIPDKRMGELLKYYEIEIIKLTKNIRLTTEDFIKRAIEKHENKYDYSLAEYVNGSTKVKIICPSHGMFEQNPSAHIRRGDNCPKCSLEIRGNLSRTSKEEFIKRSKEIHNDKFDYSLIEDYKQLCEHLTIICPIHGKFKQNGNSHMNGYDCEKCSYEKRGVDYSISKKDMLIRLTQLNNNLVYDLSNYKNTNSKIKYTCQIHGDLEQSAQKHLRGKKCWKCAKMTPWNKSNTVDFIEKAKLVHGEYYDYSLVNYIKNSEKVEIICKYHGSFMQQPNTHIDSLAGCPVCSIITSNIKDYLITIEDTKSIPCDLYIMELKNGGEVFYKIGISRYIKKRIRGIHYDSNKLYKAKVVYSLNTSLFESATIEQRLHKLYNKYKYIPLHSFKGHTECFTLDLPVEEIITYLESS